MSRSWQNQQNRMCAQTQISLDIHPFWSESSLSAWWKLGSLATHANADAQADLRLRWAHTSFRLFCHAAAHFASFLCLRKASFMLAALPLHLQLYVCILITSRVADRACRFVDRIFCQYFRFSGFSAIVLLLFFFFFVFFFFVFFFVCVLV